MESKTHHKKPVKWNWHCNKWSFTNYLPVWRSRKPYERVSSKYLGLFSQETIGLLKLIKVITVYFLNKLMWPDSLKRYLKTRPMRKYKSLTTALLTGICWVQDGVIYGWCCLVYPKQLLVKPLSYCLITDTKTNSRKRQKFEICTQNVLWREVFHVLSNITNVLAILSGIMSSLAWSYPK